MNTRLNTRPRALLDASLEASRLVVSGSDAEKFYDAHRVHEKVPSLATYLSWLNDRNMPRMPGYTKVLRNNGQSVTVIRGEAVPADQDEPVYSFAFGPDSGEYIQIGRIVGNGRTVLGWLDHNDEVELTFLEPNLAVNVDNPAKIAELTQIVAIAADAFEWSLD